MIENKLEMLSNICPNRIKQGFYKLHGEITEAQQRYTLAGSENICCSCWAPGLEFCDAFPVCLHLHDRATPGSCSSSRRIALTMFPRWSDSTSAAGGPSPRPRAPWSFARSRAPFLCVSSESNRRAPTAEAPGATNRPSPARDAV